MNSAAELIKATAVGVREASAMKKHFENQKDRN